jgi:hypothetical protein
LERGNYRNDGRFDSQEFMIPGKYPAANALKNWLAPAFDVMVQAS